MEATMKKVPQLRFNLAVALCLLILAVSLRVLPHPANFAPVTAIALFGGAILPRRLSVALPVLAMIISDAVIGFYDLRTMLVVWGCYALTALASSHWLRGTSLKQGFVLTISSSLFFFSMTNFAVWLWGNMYVHSWGGLVQCYEMALPFFRNTAISDLIYAGTLFGLYALATNVAAKRVYAVGQTVTTH